MNQIEIKKYLDEILETLDYYRGMALDAVEQEFGDSQSWPVVRSRLLKVFGDRGLANRIRSIMQNGGRHE